MAQYVPLVTSTDQVKNTQPVGRVARPNHYAYAVPVNNPYLSQDVVEFSSQQTARGVQKSLLGKLKTAVSAAFGAKAF